LEEALQEVHRVRRARLLREIGGVRAEAQEAQEGKEGLRIGLISDTHGLLRPEAARALQGSAHIIHAGDIGSPAILEELARIAPVTAVRGNNDRDAWARAIRDEETLTLDGIVVHVIHDLNELAIDPAGRGIRVVVSGHSHQPLVAEKDGVLYVNPGSAGPRRFKLPVSVAMLETKGAALDARLRTLEV